MEGDDQVISAAAVARVVKPDDAGPARRDRGAERDVDFVLSHPGRSPRDHEVRAIVDDAAAEQRIVAIDGQLRDVHVGRLHQNDVARARRRGLDERPALRIRAGDFKERISKLIGDCKERISKLIGDYRGQF